MSDEPIEGHYSRADALAYARRIRHPLKQTYAMNWIAYRFDGKRWALEPDGAPPRGDLSYMAAQAVRLTIGFPPSPRVKS